MTSSDVRWFVASPYREMQSRSSTEATIGIYLISFLDLPSELLLGLFLAMPWGLSLFNPSHDMSDRSLAMANLTPQGKMPPGLHKGLLSQRNHWNCYQGLSLMRPLFFLVQAFIEDACHTFPNI